MYYCIFFTKLFVELYICEKSMFYVCEVMPIKWKLPLIAYSRNVIIIIYMQERKRNTLTQIIPQDNSKSPNVFLLKKITSPPTSTGVCVDFSPYLKPEGVDKSGNTSSFHLVPVFNRDQRFYTPSFILKEDIIKFNENEELCLTNHIRKVRELQQEKTEMFLPKPSKANSFCQICREPFDEYLTHVNRPSHIQRMKSSEFYVDIQKLCDKINPHPKPNKQKKIKKSKKKSKDANMPSLKKKNSSGKSMQSLSTGLQSQQQCQVVV